MESDSRDIGSDYRMGSSITGIAKNRGLPISTVRNTLLKLDIKLRTRVEGVKLAAIQGKLKSKKKHAFSETHKANLSRARREWADRHAKGVRLTRTGYLEFTRGPHKGRLVHRVVMERALGRALKSREHVHHRDGNRANNDVKNLELLTIAEHVRGHRLLEIQQRPKDRNARGQFCTKNMEEKRWPA